MKLLGSLFLSQKREKTYLLGPTYDHFQNIFFFLLYYHIIFFSHIHTHKIILLPTKGKKSCYKIRKFKNQLYIFDRGVTYSSNSDDPKNKDHQLLRRLKFFKLK